MFKPDNLKYLYRHTRGMDVAEIQDAALYAYELGGDQGCFEWGCRRYLMRLSFEEKEWIEGWLFPVLKRAKKMEDLAIRTTLREISGKEYSAGDGKTKGMPWHTTCNAFALEDRLQMPQGYKSAAEKWAEQKERIIERERKKREEFSNRFAYLKNRHGVAA